jgi:hypothetical protein
LSASLWLALGCGGNKPPAQDATQETESSSGGESGSSSGSATSGSSSGSATSGSSSGASGGGARINERENRSQSAYDKENTDVVLARAARQVKANCGAAKDEEGKATGPWGKVSIKVTLGANGHSKGVAVPAPYDGKPVGKCISNAFAILVFPPWAGADTDVDWEVELVKPEDASKPPGKK